MGCRCSPACKFGLDSATKRWPKRNRASDGCCGDAAHSKRKSDHNPDASGYAHAFDLTHDVEKGPDCKEWSRLVIKDPRVTYVIFAGEIWKARTGKWEKYTGPNKHNQHMHVSIKSTATFDVSPWPWSPIPVVVRPTVEPAIDVEKLKAATIPETIEKPTDEDKGVTTGTQPEGETAGSMPPAPAVEIKASESSWKTKLGSLSIPTGVGGVIIAIGTFASGLPPYAWFAFAAILIAAMVIGYLVWKTEKDQAHSRTEKLMDAGASQEKNNLRLV